MLDIEKIKRNFTRVSDETFKKRVYLLKELIERDDYSYYEDGCTLDEYIERLCKMNLEELHSQFWEYNYKFVFKKNVGNGFRYQSVWQLFYMTDVDFIQSLSRMTANIQHNKLTFRSKKED